MSTPDTVDKASETVETSHGEQSRVRPRPALFRALGRQDPPAQLEIGGQPHQLVRVFKHDSWAATALYQGPLELAICKFQRQQGIGLLPMKWFGRNLACHESSLYHRLAGVSNIPRLLGEVTAEGKQLRHVVAHHYVPGHPLQEIETLDDEFFPALQNLLREIHRRQVAYVDLHKRENILVGDDGRPYLIDFQISFVLPRWWPGNGFLMRLVLRVLQRSDEYHLLKHFARCRPDQCGFDLDGVGKKRPWWIRLHRVVAVPFRKLRRKLLVLLGIRSGAGQAQSEKFTEEGLRVEAPADRTAA